ncbi:hypothetical protein AVEN_90299-1 [Araneus ventricosus]|uniref:Retrovirus-related Pol polyprotein from transposon TNT 1-94-like beta-barrel domain-containing protein n=1 Tax=Araneus ventricosus TaxID=182803 RepID=A0A4Y2SVR3_ARAVE|nr:hypothetical protein AVEN_90299-1 [Araneus ventricosus]
MPIRCQQRKPPTFKKGEHSNPAALYASLYWTQSMDIEFVIDSVATEHFVNDINLFIKFQKLSSSASVAEGTTNILGKGDVNLEIMDNSGKASLLLKNVLYAPQMSLRTLMFRILVHDSIKDGTRHLNQLFAAGLENTCAALENILLAMLTDERCHVGTLAALRIIKVREIGPAGNCVGRFVIPAVNCCVVPQHLN